MTAEGVTAVIAGLGTYLWLLAWGVPYPLLLGTFVAFLDLIPVIGSTVGGIVVSLVAVLIGGVLLGIVGVLVAIPVAAAIRLLLKEVAFPRLDKS